MTDAKARECRFRLPLRGQSPRRPRPWGEVRYGDNEAWGYVDCPREVMAEIARRPGIPPQETEGGHG